MEEHRIPDPRTLDPEDPHYDMGLDMRFTSWSLSEGQTINVRCGSQTFADGNAHSMQVWGPAKQNYPIWIGRFKNEFDPKGLSGCTWPYTIDLMLQGFPPDVFTEEARETVNEMVARGWQGNP